MTRPTWDEYFMSIAEVVATRSTCTRRQVGAVITADNDIVSTGYNDTPKSYPNCFEGGCSRCNSDIPSGEGLEECMCVHAEANAVIRAAYRGGQVKGATLYCTLEPCVSCSKLIINAGITRIVYKHTYPNNSIEASKLLNKCNVALERL